MFVKLESENKLIELLSLGKRVFRESVIEMIKVHAEDTGFKKVLDNYYDSFISKISSKPDSFELELFYCVKLVSQRPNPVLKIEFLEENSEFLFRFCSSIEELISCQLSFIKFINSFFSELVSTAIDINTSRDDLAANIKFCNDCLSLDPNAFFFYEGSMDVSMFLPKYDAQLSTDGGLEKQTFYDILKGSLSDYPVIIDIDLPKYKNQTSNELENMLNGLKMRLMFSGYSNESFTTNTLDNFEIVSEEKGDRKDFLIKENIIFSNNRFSLARAINKYVFLDLLTKKAYVLKDVNRLGELLKDIV